MDSNELSNAIQRLDDKIKKLEQNNNFSNELLKFTYEFNQFYLNNTIINNDFQLGIRILRNLKYEMNNQFRPLFPKGSELKEHEFKAGDICGFYFGINIAPEMSLDHMGIVVSENSAFLYVLPICTKTDRHKNAYHPIDNNGLNESKCDKFYYLMKESEFSFIKHDSILNLSDLKCISKKRTFKIIDNLNINSDFFVYITEYTSKKIFADNLFLRDSKIKKMNNIFIKQLNEEFAETHIQANINDKIDIYKYIKGYYGELKEEISVDTSKAGRYPYTITFIDEFKNEVSKDFVVTVSDFAEKTPVEIREKVGSAGL